MMTKKYASYADIDRDLEILKIEKEIHYQKMTQSVHDTKESLSPGNLMGGVPKAALGFLGNLSGPIKGMAINFLLKKIFKR